MSQRSKSKGGNGDNGESKAGAGDGTGGKRYVTPLPRRFLNTQEAARYLRLSPRTLDKQRIQGSGPRYYKFGARVVYALRYRGLGGRTGHDHDGRAAGGFSPRSGLRACLFTACLVTGVIAGLAHAS